MAECLPGYPKVKGIESIRVVVVEDGAVLCRNPNLPNNVEAKHFNKGDYTPSMNFSKFPILIFMILTLETP
jgi:hypothetical protein